MERDAEREVDWVHLPVIATVSALGWPGTQLFG